MGVPDEFGYAHHSGRFDRSPEALATTILNLTKLPKVAVIGMTEIATPERHKALDSALTKVGWELIYQPQHDKDTGIAFDRAVFSELHAVTKVLSKVKTYSTSGHLRASWAALLVMLRFKESEHTYIFSAAHTPSHVATTRDWYHLNRAVAHRSGMKAWNKELRRVTLLWKPTGGRTLSMDLNMDIEQRWVRQYLTRMMPTMHLIHDSRSVDTHDKRTIDVILIGRRTNPLKWFGGRYIRVVEVKDSDHKTIIVHLRRVR